MPQQVLNCMVAQQKNDRSELDNYMPAYKKLCSNYARSICDIGLVVLASVGRANLESMLENTTGTVDFLKSFVEWTEDEAFKAKLPHMLFPMQSQQARWIEPGKGANSNLNKRQASAGGRFMRSIHDFHAERKRLHVGMALSTSPAGTPLLLQVNK